MYRDQLEDVQIELSNSQAGPGRIVKQEHEHISHNQLFVSQLKFQLICLLAAGPSFGFAIFVFYTAEGDRGERKWLIIRSLCRHGGGE